MYDKSQYTVHSRQYVEARYGVNFNSQHTDVTLFGRRQEH